MKAGHSDIAKTFSGNDWMSTRLSRTRRTLKVEFHMDGSLYDATRNSWNVQGVSNSKKPFACNETRFYLLINE
jgi:hypothetical protein